MQPRLTSPIREARTKKGLSQDDLASELSVSKAAISAWENDRNFPETPRLAGLARALKPHLNLDRYLAHVERVAA